MEKQKISHIVNIDSKLEEIKIENFKRLKILKKIKQEKMLLQEERKKLEELKESLNISDIESTKELLQYTDSDFLKMCNTNLRIDLLTKWFVKNILDKLEVC